MASFGSLQTAASKLRNSVSTSNALAALARDVPAAFSLQDIGEELVVPLSNEDAGVTLLAVLACLREQTRRKEAPGDSTWAKRLASFIAKLLAPISQSADGEEQDQDEYGQTAERVHNLAGAGIDALRLLLQQVPTRLDEQALLTLVALSAEGEAWAPSDVRKAAADLLDSQIANKNREAFIADVVLRDYLRALFSKSRPATVTAAGRKAEYVDRERETGLPDESRKTKPWKYEDFRAISVFSWAVDEADEQLIAQHWPLFIPVLLTLVDDSATRVRARGLTILANFLEKFPDQKLRETGLGSVFEEAIFPTLLYLPSLTPVDESLQLLEPAYNALLVLASKASTTKGKEDKDRLLDKILRDGVFTAYSHARDHVRVVELLLRQVTVIVAIMGINSVKHLKDLVPMVSAVMTDPFAGASPATLLVAITTLQAVISNAWPRVSDGPWRDEVLKALVLAWLNVHENATKTPDDDRIASELIKATNVLAAAMKSAHSSLSSHAAPLVSKESILGPLFAGAS